MRHEQQIAMARGGAVLRTYWRHTVAYPWSLLAVLATTVLVQAGELATPWYLRQLFNTIATGTPSDATYAALLKLVLIIAGISAGVWALRRIFGFSLMYFEGRIMRDLLDSGFGGLIRHSYNFFVSRFAGSLTHKVNKFSRAYETMADAFIMQFIPTALFVGGAITILYFRHPALGIALAVWSVVFMTFQLSVARLRQPLRVARAERETETTGALADAIGNHTTIQLFSGTRYEQSLLGTYTRRWYEAMLRAWKADEMIWAVLGLFMLSIEVGLLWGAVILWQRGLLMVGDFVLIQAYLLTTFERLVAINRELRRFYDAYADASEMVGLLEMRKEVADMPGATPLRTRAGAVVFKNVSFAFTPAHPVLAGLNIAIAPGERVALVGSSGAGKSTITKLLLRLYDVSAGSIEIDGQSIASATQESLRDAIAFVPQEPILFHRTLMENIRYGKRDASEREVIDAARRAHCDAFISALPEGYDTYVGERGIKLSGGERQRIAIARAILKNAPVLILDEATSSLDSESEALIQDALRELMRGKTVIVIAHRLSTIMHMDRILVIKDGAVVSEGSHVDLLRGGGLYQKLWHIQAGGFIADDDNDGEEDSASANADAGEDDKEEGAQLHEQIK